MTGAIIGDLAAWSWENDREGFYRKLVTDRSVLSECGLSMLAAFATGMDRYDFQVFQKEFSDFFTTHSRGISCSQEWEDFFSSGCRRFNKKVSDRIYAACLVLAAWQTYPEEMAIRLSNSLKLDKEGFYASSFASVIWHLRQGETKNDIVYKLAKKDFRVETILRWHESHGNPSDEIEEDLLYYLNYAWRCFRYSWDFTSAIHEAMRCPDFFDRHLLGMLTGAIAEAMYGCRFNYIKKKYADNSRCNCFLSFPKTIENEFEDVLSSIRQYEKENRVFFPKNDAMTNVERHHWIPFSVKEIPCNITGEYHRRMVKAFETGWDCRFGVYLDDGWFYVYRSYCLLARFRMRQVQNYWKIEDLQRCADDDHDPYEAMRSLLYSIMESWYDITDDRDPSDLTAADVCKYYMGEKECPFEIRTPKGWFWHGEMMFVTGNLSMDHWKESARSAELNMSIENASKFRTYSKEHQAILIYMSNLYAKWRPYDDQKWMKEY